MVESQFFTSVILLIIISSIVTPIALKAIYSKDEKDMRVSEKGAV